MCNTDDPSFSADGLIIPASPPEPPRVSLPLAKVAQRYAIAKGRRKKKATSMDSSAMVRGCRSRLPTIGIASLCEFLPRTRKNKRPRPHRKPLRSRSRNQTSRMASKASDARRHKGRPRSSSASASSSLSSPTPSRSLIHETRGDRRNIERLYHDLLSVRGGRPSRCAASGGTRS